MSVTENERNQLFAWLEEHMGKERAATMMNLLPPVGWGEVATKRDLDYALERLEAKVDAIAERLDTKVDAIAERLDTKIDGVVDRMATRGDLDALRSDLQRTFITWILTAQATVIAAVVGLVALLR